MLVPTTALPPINQILQGHAVDVINQTLPDNSIDLCFTSPPYFGLRTYTTDLRELGRETSMHDYNRGLIEVFRALWPKLKSTASVFVNIGDTYNGDKSGTSNGRADQGSTIGAQKKGAVVANEKINKVRQPGLPQKSLLGIPQRFRLAMTDELGYCLRNEIVWNKPNAMPGSAMDRWASSHEYILFFTKEPDGYFFETQYEPFKTGNGDSDKLIAISDGGMVFGGSNKHTGYGNHQYSGETWKPQTGIGGRIARGVWTINTQGRKDAHFATFPDELPRRAILAACPEYICKKCGFMREIEYKRVVENTRPGLDSGNGKSGSTADPNAKFHNSDISVYRQRILRLPAGRLTSCSCGVGWKPGVVFDPFCGRGTTCIIARMLGRDYIGVDLNPGFCKISRNNLEPLMKEGTLTNYFL